MVMLGTTAAATRKVPDLNQSWSIKPSLTDQKLSQASIDMPAPALLSISASLFSELAVFAGLM
jgi:hypothetical protein